VDSSLFATSQQYVLRVRSVDAPAVVGTSGTFAVLPESQNYYVNIAGDANFADNEYTTAAGDAANTGLTPNSASWSKVRSIRCTKRGSARS
jgi:hypothetical protein